MADISTLLDEIDDNIIPRNNAQLITGEGLNTTLKDIVNGLAERGYIFKGVVASTSYTPTEDYPSCYILAAAGAYANFDGYVVPANMIAIVHGDGTGMWEGSNFNYFTDAERAALEGVALDVENILQIVTLTPSSNLFDATKATDGYYMWIYGPAEAASLFYSDKIPVIPGKTYTLQVTPPGSSRLAEWIRFIVGYDAGGNLLSSGQAEQVNSFTVPEGWAYAVFTYYLSQKYWDIAFVEGTEIIPFDPFGTKAELNPDSVKNINIQDATITVEKMADGIFVNTDNLFNKDTIINNAYIDIYTGNPVNSNNWWGSDFIPVNPEKQYSVSNMRSYCFYDSDKQFMSGFDDYRENYTFTPPTGSAYLRFSGYRPSGTGWLPENIMLNEGEQLLPYVEYGKKLNPALIKDGSIGTEQLSPNAIIPSVMPALSKTGALGVSKHFNSLAAIYTHTDFPQYVKRGMNLSTSAKFTSFGALRMGVGKTTTHGVWVEINSTNAVLYRYNGQTAYILETKPHGLTVQSFLNLSININDLIPVIRIGTLSGAVELTFDELDYELMGQPFIEPSSGNSLSDVNFHVSTKHFSRDVWIFGDSYLSWYESRWPYQLVNALNVNNFLLDGVAGGGSSALYNELLLALNYGKPRFLVWCLGMNDTYSEWANVFVNLKSICQNNGITLILQTIPWPAGGSKADINNAIRQSGYRYFDGYAAVSSDNSGTWYPDYSEDDAHTSVIGAKAMASRFVADFPEILQY